MTEPDEASGTSTLTTVTIDLATPGVPINEGLPAGAAGSSVVVGMIAAALYRRGAFYPLDAFGVVVVSVALSGLALRRCHDRVALGATLCAGALAGWWLSRSAAQQNAVAFLPLGASIVGFLAAFLVMRRLKGGDVTRIATAVVALGALSAAGGIAGVLWHFRPLAQPAGRYWEVATTLTYPAASAALFIVALLMALSLDLQHRLVRAATCLCLAGLVGTQSHWDLLALGVGALAVPSRRWTAALWPLTAGLGAGVALVAAASGRMAGGTSGLLVVVAVALSTVTIQRHASRWRTRMALLALVPLAAVIALTMTVAPFGRGPVEPTNQGQTLAWSASSAAWRSSIWTGVGPPKPVTSSKAVDDNPGFAPDGYLTILADSGLVGLALLLGLGGVVARSLRRRTLAASCAIGATVAFAVTGAVDFDWQLPALALLGGSVAGLAACGPPDEVAEDEPMDEPSRRRWWRGRTAVVLWVVAVGGVVASQLVTSSDGHVSSQSHAAQVTEPSPSATPLSPGRDILRDAHDSTDPYMLTVRGLDYLYTSEGTTFSNVPLRMGSPGHWSAPIDVLPHLPPWAEPGLTWAPDVQRVSGGWALYFSSLLRGVTPYTHCIGSAFARSPRGPFRATAKPMICQLDHRGSIDARVFVQSKKRLVMIWKSEDNANPLVPGPDQDGATGIFAQDLSPNGKTLLGRRVKIFAPSEAWEGTIVEAPDMIEAWGTYWLFFSGNWYDSSSYGIGVAQCQSPFGPCSDPSPTPFLGSNLQGQGPGEESLSVNGNDVFLLYNPFKANDPGPVISRPVAMTRLGFTPQGPYLAAS